MRYAIVTTSCLAVLASGCCHQERPLPVTETPPPPTTQTAQQPADAAIPASATAPATSSTASASAPKATGLTATFSPDGATFTSSLDAQIQAMVRNEGSEPIEVRMDMLSSAILSLDVLDASGKRMLTIPPPMPLPPDEVERAKKMLAPGASERFTYYLHIFSPKLPAGTYSVRMRGMPSEPATFIITGEP